MVICPSISFVCIQGREEAISCICSRFSIEIYCNLQNEFILDIYIFLIHFTNLWNLHVKLKIPQKIRNIAVNQRLPLVCLQRGQKTVCKTWHILQPVCALCTLWRNTIVAHHIESALVLDKDMFMSNIFKINLHLKFPQVVDKPLG